MSHVVSGLALTHFSAGYPRRQVIRDLTVPRCSAPTAAENPP